MSSSQKKTVLLSVAIMSAAALALVAMGRIPFCKCGLIRLWSSDIYSNQQSQQFTDPYTFTHIIHGALLYASLWFCLGKRLHVAALFLMAVGLESMWEIFENTDFVINRYREATISLDYYGDSIFNSMGDILAMMFGFWLAHRLPPRVTSVAMIVLDAMLLFAIRDSLAVNLVMLIFPLDIIKQWQLR